MAITLPLPVRVAAGLLVTGWDAVRALPQDLPALSVTVAGRVMRLTLRVQQEITELAGRGDELLSSLTSRPSEHPTWAHFDEDDAAGDGVAADDSDGDEAASDGPGGTDAGDVRDEVRGAARSDLSDAVPATIFADVSWTPTDDDFRLLTDEFFDGAADAGISAEDDDAVATALLDGAGFTDSGDGLDGADMLDSPAALDRDGSVDSVNAIDGQNSLASAAVLKVGRALDEPLASPTAAPSGDGSNDDDHDQSGPAVLPGYDRMTLAQVRGHLRGLDPSGTAELLAYEQAGAGRPPFLTLLSNRIATLEHEAQ